MADMTTTERWDREFIESTVPVVLHWAHEHDALRH